MVVRSARTAQPVGLLAAVIHSSDRSRYRARTMSRTPFDELVHRVNNLLGTIGIQAELARSEGTLTAHQAALASIVESAGRTQAEIQKLRAAAKGGHA